MTKMQRSKPVTISSTKSLEKNKMPSVVIQARAQAENELQRAIDMVSTRPKEAIQKIEVLHFIYNLFLQELL